MVFAKKLNGLIGENTVLFDGSLLNSGVYYYSVIAGNESAKSIHQNTLLLLSNTLGFKLANKETFSGIKDQIFNKLVETLIEWRINCKKNKDYINADKIRSLLNDSKVEIKDLPDNKYKWEIRY